MTVQFTVPGQPVGKGRPRFARSGAGVRVWTPDETVAYEELVRWRYKTDAGTQSFGDRAVRVIITAYYPIPGSAGKKVKADMREGKIRPTVKPDADNLAKIIMDALNGIAWKDDKQVVSLAVHKVYRDAPCVGVFIEDVYNTP